MWTYHFMNRSPLSETFQWCCWWCFGDVLLHLWPHRQNTRWIHSLIQHPKFLGSFLLLCSCGVGWVKITKGGLLAHYQLWKVIIEFMGGEDVIWLLITAYMYTFHTLYYTLSAGLLDQQWRIVTSRAPAKHDTKCEILSRNALSIHAMPFWITSWKVWIKLKRILRRCKVAVEKVILAISGDWGWWGDTKLQYAGNHFEEWVIIQINVQIKDLTW